MTRFDKDHCGVQLKQLDTLKQVGLVLEYQERFEIMLNIFNWSFKLFINIGFY